MASPEQLAYNRLRAQHDSYQTMTGGGGNTAVSRDPVHAAKLATIPTELARMAAALKAKGIDAEAEYDALSGPKAAPVDANQAYGGISEAIRPGVDTVASVKKLWQYINRNLTDLASNASFEEEHSNQPYIEDRLADLLKTADGDPVTIAFDMGGNLEFDNNVLYVPVGNMWRYRGLILGPEFVKRVVGLLSKQTSSLELNEFARGDGPDRGNYLKELARAWYNMDFELLAHIARQGGNPMKHRVDVQETIERMLERGIHCGDGRVRKYYIGYNSDFDGVEIQSHDHYEHSDYDDDGTDIDDRTGKPWGPYDVVEFSSDELDESINEATDPKRAKLGRMIYKYFGQIYDYGDDDGLNYLDEQGDLWNQLMDKYNGEIDDIVAGEPIEVLMQAAQELKGIAGDMKYELDEAAQGHTIEAHGVRGMDRRTWHKTFRNTDQMMAWAEKHDAEIVGTRDLEQARHHNLSPAKQGAAEGSLNELSKDTLKSYAKKAVPDMQASQKRSEIEAGKAASTKDDETAKTHYDAAKQAKDRTEKRMAGISGAIKRVTKQGVAEGSDQQLSIRQLATISDEALDKAYGYGRSSPGNTFGWQANLKSAAYAKHMIDKGVRDIDEIADAIHKGWNVTARAFVKNPDRFDDTEKLKAAGKLEAKLQQRAKLMNIDYSQLPNDEQEKDRVVARALLQAITGGGEQDITEMDKSQTPPGRDTGPREGPEKIAKPITKEKMVKHALDALSKSMAKKDDKKKDVKESQGGYSTSPAELARTAPGIKMAKMAGQSAIAAAKNKLDSLRARNSEQWDKAMQSGSARIHGVPPQFPADAGRLMGDRAEYMKTVKSAPSEWDDTTGSIGMDPQMKSPFPPLMKKLQAAVVQEGRVKELADDLKTMSDADFMKKYGKAKAAIRADMKRVDEARSDYTPDEMADMLSGKRSQKQIDADAERTRGPNKAPPTKESTQSRAKRLNEKLATSDTLSQPAAGAGISRLGKKDVEPEFDFRKGLAGDDPEFFEPDVRIGKPVEPNAADTDAFMSAVDSYGEQNPYMQSWGGKFADQDTRIAPLRPGEFNVGGTTWRRVEDPAAAPAKKEVQWIPSSEADSIASWKANNPGKSAADWGSIPAAGKPAAASGLPKMRFDRATNSLVPVDQPVALDLSPKDKDKFDRQTRSVKPADGSGANPNIDAATRDRARAWAAQQNAPGAASAGAMRSSGTPVDTAKKKTDWKSIYNLNKSIIGSNPNLIKPGMKLKMPDGSTYRVQPGDNLSKIAASQSQINELSTNKLAQYKTAAAKDAKEADKEGDFKRGDKRFHGIVQATKKQFDNDDKKVDESRAARRALMARIVNSR
jgi:hypothetical protein